MSGDDTPGVSKTSADQIEYPALSVPSSLTLEVLDYTGESTLESVSGFPVHHLYVKCSEIVDRRLPLDANPREPSKTPQVRSMQETLSDEPEDFVKKNNGIVMLSTGADFQDEEGTIQFEFQEDEGICNGGHTYFAMQTADQIGNNAVVHLEVLEIPEELKGEERKEEIISVARSRNNNNRLERRSEADFLGYYNHFQNALDQPSLISWHEGDSNAIQDSISAVHFIRLIKSLDALAYYHPVYNSSGNRHKGLSTARTRIHSDWLDRMETADKNDETPPLHYLVPFVNDVFYLRDLLSYSLLKDDLDTIRRTSFYQDYVKQGKRELHTADFDGSEGVDLTDPMEVILLGLFRSNIWLFDDPSEEKVEFSGWYIDPESLWDQRKIDILNDMSEYFMEVDRDPKQFIRVSAPYEKDLFQLGIGQSPPDPDIVYDTETRQRYTKTKDRKEATHWLKEEQGLLNFSEEAPSQDSSLYVED